MGFSVSVAQRGLDLNLFSKGFASKVVQPFVEATADFAFNQMYSNAPWRTGFLAMSITKKVSEGKAVIKPMAPYAIFVEKGTRPHIIRPINAKCLAFSSGMLGGLVFARLVNHPGTKPNPFVEKTAMETRDESSYIFSRVWQEKIGGFEN
jgi:HK97 gp10 family phage protein